MLFVRILITLSLCIMLHASIEPLRYDRVFLVDKINNTYLFRGNMPTHANGTFAEELLKHYLRKAALEKSGVELPEEYELIDITLLNPSLADEIDGLNVERAFFKQNPNKGKLIHYPFVGDNNNPKNITDPQERYKLSITLPSWQKDLLYFRLRFLHNQMKTASKSTVFYFHCGHGQDRTGELSATYEMQFMNKSYNTVMDFNIKLGMDVPENINAVDWYCEYLQNGKSYKTTKCQQ
ncbi:imidazoleglycerol-phosphate dehydratase [Acrasis kona]|uniref:Imidazoleglycerol-phosphate dehydratase n=1 Tax=Acrasis kona TaxID=1008807 RepID=A0AAW2YZW1_9EUKA